MGRISTTDITTSSLLSISFFSVAPVARAAGGGEVLSGEAKALELAAAHNAPRRPIQAGSIPGSQQFVAFDSKGELVDPLAQRGRLLDIFV